MTGTPRQHWDERYAASELVWSSTPNAFVEQVAGGLQPGRALDLGAGEARNALWLIEQGWSATAVDFSKVALDRARRLADERLGSDADRLTTVVADILDFAAEPVFDLVLVIYIHLPEPERRRVLETAAGSLASGGTLLVIAHHSDNLAHGVGGPQDPALLYSAEDVLEDLSSAGLDTVRADRETRVVAGDAGPRDAIDAVVVLRRP